MQCILAILFIKLPVNLSCSVNSGKIMEVLEVLDWNSNANE